MNIRPATEHDVPALQTLLRRSWLTNWAPELAFETVQRFAATDPAGHYARDKWNEFIIAEDSERIVGMFHAEGDHLHAIHLDPTHKRRGIGTHLMDSAEERIAQDHDRARLEVLVFNRAAIAFYEQRGWVRGSDCQIDECGELVSGFEMVKDFAHEPAAR